MALVPDLVTLSKLETEFHQTPPCTQHFYSTSGNSPKQRVLRKEQRWRKNKELGSGSFGVVWLEQCIQGDEEGELRAVKRIKKTSPSDSYRELETIALFSHKKYERCFVKSFGWYENVDSVFIAMEYLPKGDLQQYLRRPLSEKEGQTLVLQVLEGLHYMHGNGFAHRDLKPSNILVVWEGPDWWVKIADFGISKRAIGGETALRTLTGTPTFMAPEVLGFVLSDDLQTDSYTIAVDIWSLSVVAYLILTGDTLFADPHRLGQYVAGKFAFPSVSLLANKISNVGCDFIERLMAPKPELRPKVQECLQHPWLSDLTDSSGIEKIKTISASSGVSQMHSEAEASARWSTQEPTSFQGGYSSSTLYASSTSPESKGLLPGIEAASGVYHGTLEGHKDSVNAVMFSPDGKQIASASWDKTVRLWDASIGAEQGILVGHQDPIYAVIFSPSGKMLASASSNIIQLWDTTTGAALGVLRGHEDKIWALAFSPDGKEIASASADKTIGLWYISTRVARGKLVGHKNWVNAIAFSVDGKQLVSGSADNDLRLWNMGIRAASGVFRGHSDWVNAVAFSSDGRRIVSGSADLTIRLWDASTKVLVRTLEGHKRWICAVAISPDGKQIVSGSIDQTVRTWDAVTGAAQKTSKDHKGPVHAVAFSPNGRWIASASDDKTIKIWNADSLSAIKKKSKFGSLKNILRSK